VPLPDTPAKSVLPAIEGVVPSLKLMPPGCRFSNRCQYVDDICRTRVPALETCALDHAVACHRWRELAA
jgi:oligopeptide/dipeptide ABC transporter ATP-binding protein